MTALPLVADAATYTIPATNLAPAMVDLWRRHANAPQPNAEAQQALGAHDGLLVLRHSLLYSRRGRGKRTQAVEEREATYRAALTKFALKHPLTADAGVVPPRANPNRQQGDPLDLTPGDTSLGYSDWDTYFLLQAKTLA